MNIELTDREVELIQASLQQTTGSLQDEIDTFENEELNKAIGPILKQYLNLRLKIATHKGT